MCWAIHKETGLPVYVGNLPAEQAGDGCLCRCPACNEDLQAVNVGKDASHFDKPGTLGMFFRHPKGHQREQCQFLAARLAALHLLITSDVLDLPPPRRNATVNGISGHAYEASACGPRLTTRVAHRQWLDTQTAQITCEDGRVVRLCLEAQPGFMTECGIDAVITIQISDPDIASWPPEKILRHLKLENRMLCWERHWSDEALIKQARHQAQHLAYEALDGVPPELAEAMKDCPNWQKSETLLHAKVKEILANATGLRVPGCMLRVERTMCDGSMGRRILELPNAYLRIRNVQTEHAMTGMVSDVSCVAHPASEPDEEFILVVEVAVTHRVDQAKAAKIKEQGLACLEIDLTRMLGLPHRVEFDRLRAEILEATTGKTWIHHPAIDSRRTQLRDELARDDREIADRLRLQNQKTLWLARCDAQTLLNHLRLTLSSPSKGARSCLTQQGFEVQCHEIAQALSQRGFPQANDPMLYAPHGLLPVLMEIQACHDTAQPLTDDAVFWAWSDRSSGKSYISIGLLALRTYDVGMASDQGMLKLRDLRHKVHASLKRLEYTYARSSVHDRLIAAMFPEMKDGLDLPYGTASHIAQLATAKQEQERQQDREHEARLQRREVAWLAVSKEIGGEWSSSQMSETLDTTLRQTAVVQMTAKFQRSGVDVQKIISSAWEARGRGILPRHWFVKQQIEDEGRAKLVAQALKTGGLV